MRVFSAFTAAALAASLLLSGCRVRHHGDKDNVNIQTPFGSMDVKTGDAVDTSSIGLTQYPGSTPYKDEDGNGHNKSNANVNFNFGDFHFGVRTASLRTADSTDQILSFYRKDLGRYGDVLECRDGRPVGQPTRTAQGLTCSDKQDSGTGSVSTDHGLELRAGSPKHMHIAATEPKNGANKIVLVALDLPKGLDHHDGDSASE